MHFEATLQEAAHRANKAVSATLSKYRTGRVHDEDDITGVLVGQLDSQLEGQIGDLTWDTSVVRHRAGSAAEEKRIGADLIIHVRLKTPQISYSKGVLVQAKRSEPGISLSVKDHQRLVDQCNTMLGVTPESYVFNYAHSEMRCGSALWISGLARTPIHEECSMTSYRFFYELFRCPIGDRQLSSSLVADLPVPTVVKVRATLSP